jgi:hypothetical protein
MAKFGIGQALTRREDQRLVTGTGQYIDVSIHDACAIGIRFFPSTTLHTYEADNAHGASTLQIM